MDDDEADEEESWMRLDWIWVTLSCTTLLKIHCVGTAGIFLWYITRIKERISLRKVDVDRVMYVVELVQSTSLADWRKTTKTWIEEGAFICKILVARNRGMSITLAKCRTLGFVSFALLILTLSLIMFIVVHVGHLTLMMIDAGKSL